MSPGEVRRRLRAAGFAPIPVNGKKPRLNDWQKLTDATAHDIDQWDRTRPVETNTGVLNARNPFIDLDVLNPDAASAAEQLVRARYAERGVILVRFGKRPKRAIPFRTDEPFAKIAVTFVTEPGAPGEKVEMLGDGQQCVVHGVHPDTGRPYEWFGGSLDETKRDTLPHIDAEEARELVNAVVALLTGRFGYRVVEPKSKPKKNGVEDSSGPADWAFTNDDLIDHDRLAVLAFRFARSGMAAGALVNFLRAQVAALTDVDPDRRQRRLNEIPGMVDSAFEKIEAESRPPPIAARPTRLDEVVAVCRDWLALKDDSAILVPLGAVAANMLEGPPVWVMLIGPSSSAKTALFDAVSALPFIHSIETFTPAGLLSGSSKKDKAKEATGGVLFEIGAFGIIMFKDFGSVLELRHENRAELMTALRRIYDGEFIRTLGVDGGRKIRWKGKAGCIAATTQAYDNYHAVIGSRGERFINFRIEADAEGQFDKVRMQFGSGDTFMRERLREVIAGLFAALPEPLPEPERLTEGEYAALREAVSVAIRLRAGVIRHRVTREVEDVLDPEGRLASSTRSPNCSRDSSSSASTAIRRATSSFRSHGTASPKSASKHGASSPTPGKQPARSPSRSTSPC